MTTADTVRRRRIGRWALAVLLLVPFLFLFAPTVPDTDCLRTLHIGRHAQFIHNCDTPVLTTSTLNLEQFIFEANPWRTRPVYILTGAALAYAVEPVAVALRPVLARSLTGNYNIETILRRLPHYLSLQLLNFAMLAATILLGARLLGGMGTPLAIGLGATIATSDVVHGTFWIPHSSFMNVMVPIGAAFCFLMGCRFRIMSAGWATLVGLVVAAAILTYGYPITWIPATLLGWLFMAWRERRWLPPLTEFPRALGFVVGACLPVLASVAFTRSLNLPVAYETGNNTHQFVWLWEAYQAGQPIPAVLGQHWQAFVGKLDAHLMPQALYPLAATALLLVAGLLFRRGRLTLGTLAADPVLAAAAAALVCMAVFNFFQGYYEPRLQNPAIMALFLALARAAWLTRLEWLGTALLGLGAAGQLYLGMTGAPLTVT